MNRTLTEYPIAPLLDDAAVSPEAARKWTVDLDFPSDKLGRRPLDEDRSQPGRQWSLPEGRLI